VKKTHMKIKGVDARNQGQTEFEYTHQAACGYVRDNVTSNKLNVDCKLCLREIENSEGIDDLSNYGGGHG